MSLAAALPRSADNDGVHVAAAMAASLVMHAVVLWLLGLAPRAAAGPPPVLVASRGEIALVIPSDRPSVAPDARSPEAVRPTRQVPEDLAPRPDAVEPSPAAHDLAEPALARALADPRGDVERLPADERHAQPDETALLESGLAAARLIDGSGRPRYPAACVSRAHRRGGCEGTGAYEIEIDEDGHVVRARTVASAGCPHLDRAAELFFIQRSRFEPVIRGGKAAGWRGVLRVKFELQARDSGAE